jgi:trimeric autotransporter adhesin
VNSTSTRRRTRSSKLLVAVLLVAGANAGVVGNALPAQAVVTNSQHPIAGWSTNGPVRAVKIVGDRVYVGGTFDQVRGPGGTPVVARTNLFAIDRNTGALIPGFVANTNGIVRAIESDGTSVYVAGGFTTVNGATRRFLAALDPATGAVRAFNPNPQSQVYGLGLRGNSLYLGGVFSSVGGQPRNRIAMVDKTTGALNASFNPNADGAVRTFAFSPNGARIYVGGDFANIAGTAQQWLVALNPDTGAYVPLVFQQYQGPVLDLDVDPDGSRVYAALGGVPGAGNRADAWNANTGVRLWRNEADGDTQAIEYTNGEVYFGFHEGFGGNPLRHILGADAATGAIDPNFQPNVNSFWGVWSIDASGGTLAVGGEFTQFDGVNVQGVALLPSLFAGDTTPPSTPSNLISTGHTSTSASLSWSPSTDNNQLAGYEIVRDGIQVGFSTAASFTDSNLTPSTAYTYAVRAVDANSNESALSNAVTVTTSLPLVVAGSTWRYLDNGTNQGTAWRAAGFDDSTWTSGNAQLGYGDGDEVTTVGFGPNASQKYITTYFRRTFNVANPGAMTSLGLHLLRDDGAVVYINGTEVARSNMPAGTISSNTLAPANVDGANESTFIPFNVASGSLVAGANTIAVEVHQNSAASSDLSFDLALDAEVNSGGGDTTKPTAPGALTLGTVTANSVALSWTASTDDVGVDHYAVLRNGSPIGTNAATNYTDNTVADGRAYTYTVVAVDAANNTSDSSNAVVANTPDVTPPSTPGPLAAQNVTSTTATISWVAATDNVGVDHYNVFRDGVQIGTTGATTFNDSGLTQQTTYSYTVVAVDAANLASASSAPLSVTTPAPSATVTLLATGSIWRYLDNGTNQGTAWRGVGFNDSTWASGPGLLGYGHNDEATVVGFGPNASQKYITTYFRSTFTVANAGSMQALLLRLIRDDGAVVYINGTEVARSNMPAGAITSTTFASTNVAAPADRAFNDFTIPTNVLVTGTNTIAVEVHQNYRASTDLAFDLALIANP